MDPPESTSNGAIPATRPEAPSYVWPTQEDPNAGPCSNLYVPAPTTRSNFMHSFGSADGTCSPLRSIDVAPTTPLSLSEGILGLDEQTFRVPWKALSDGYDVETMEAREEIMRCLRGVMAPVIKMFDWIPLKVELVEETRDPEILGKNIGCGKCIHIRLRTLAGGFRGCLNWCNTILHELAHSGACTMGKGGHTPEWAALLVQLRYEFARMILDAYGKNTPLVPPEEAEHFRTLRDWAFPSETHLNLRAFWSEPTSVWRPTTTRVMYMGSDPRSCISVLSSVIKPMFNILLRLGGPEKLIENPKYPERHDRDLLKVFDDLKSSSEFHMYPGNKWYPYGVVDPAPPPIADGHKGTGAERGMPTGGGNIPKKRKRVLGVTTEDLVQTKIPRRMTQFPGRSLSLADPEAAKELGDHCVVQ